MKNKLNPYPYITAAFLSILLFMNPGNASFTRHMRILVYPFTNTGNAGFSWISAGMTDTVVADLGRLTGIMVISNEDRRKAVQEIELGQTGLLDEKTTARVGKMTGADVIFTGSYSVSGGNIRVIAKLLKVETGSMENTVKLDGTLDGIFDLQDKIVYSLIAESAKIKIPYIKTPGITDKEKELLAGKKKPDISAYELYSRGLELQDTNPAEAMKFFKKALKVDGNYVEALREAGYTAGNTFNSFSEALEYLDKADAISVKRNETRTAGYAVLLNKTGIVYCLKGDYNIALGFLEMSKKIPEGLGLQNTDDYANLIMHFGIVYRDKGAPEKAIEYYMQSKSINESLGLRDTIGYAKLMNNIGIVYGEKGDLNSALEYYNKSGAIREKLGLVKTGGYAKLMYNIGNEYRKKGDLNRAMEYYNRSKTTWESLDLKKTDGYARLIQNIALIYEKQGKASMAGQYYRMAYEIFNSLGLPDAGIADKKAKEFGY
jgi:tetratricopeptide (TPR) repeat protein